MKRVTIGRIQKKILLLLMAGVALGLNRSFKRQLRIQRELVREWRAINRQSLERSVQSLYQSHLVETKENHDGTSTLVLSNNGKRRAPTFDVETMRIKTPARWDGKWRIIIFDIPHPLKKVRESLRYLLKHLGCFPLQKSVFVHPFNCEKEIEFITELHKARRYVRFIIADSIDNEIDLKQHFGLQ